jgi:hypothetical protein
VRTACLTEAIAGESRRPSERNKFERRLPSGIWGGTDPASRWAKAVIHLDDCTKGRSCQGCRPIPERMQLLEVKFRSEAQSFLTAEEQVA